MKLNVYSVFDKVRGVEKRVAFDNTDGSLIREQLKFDVLGKVNPQGIPFSDLSYLQIAIYDTETHSFENISSREVDIVKSYNLKFENEVLREEPSQQSIDDSVKSETV